MALRILFSLDKYTTRDGGADRLARGAVRALVACGHDVLVLEAGAGDTPVERSDAGVLIRAVPLAQGWLRDTDWQTLAWNAAWKKPVADTIAAFRPDLVLTQNILAPASIDAARRAGVRTAILFHGHRCMSPTFFYHDDALTAPRPTWWNMPWRVRLKWPLVQRTLALYRRAYLESDILIANSAYAASALERFFGRTCPVLYPLLDMHGEALPDTSRIEGAARAGDTARILFVKPQRNKGVDVLHAVARRLSGREFYVVGKASRRVRARFAALSNVTLAGWVDDMEAVFRTSRVLFGPSQNPEPFGKIFVEAGVRGIPAVASCPGGSVEAVGEGGVLLPILSPPEAWAEALESLCVDHARHDALSRAATANARALIAATTPEAFDALLRCNRSPM